MNFNGAVENDVMPSMVIYYFLIYGTHDSVEAECRDALEPCVGLAFAAHAINNVLAFDKLPRHIDDGEGVVLQVGVDGHQGIAVAYALVHACP